MAEVRAGTPEQAAFLRRAARGRAADRHRGARRLRPRARFEDVRRRFDDLITRGRRRRRRRALRFPPVLAAAHARGHRLPAARSRTWRAPSSPSRATRPRPPRWPSAPSATRTGAGHQHMTDLVLTPAACYPVYPAIAARGPLPAGGVTIDAGRRLRLPPRAVRRPGAAADVPPARAGADRRARERSRPGATSGATARIDAAARASGLEAEFDVATDPFFGRTGRMLAATQREQALKFEVLVPIAGPEPTAVASFNYHQEHFAACFGIDAGRRRRGAHRLPGLRPRAHHAGAAARPRPRPGGLARRGARGAVAVVSGDAAADQPARPRPGDLRPTTLHGGERTYPETNCYADILDRAAARPRRRAAGRRWALVRMDFEGDQWTFFKPPPGGPRARCSASTSTRCSRTGRCPTRSPSSSPPGRTMIVELDSWYLPDTAATELPQRSHVKTTVAIEAIDREARAAALLPQRRRCTSSPARTTAARCGLDGSRRRGAAALHRAGALRRRAAPDRRGAALRGRASCSADHLARRPRDQPVRRASADAAGRRPARGCSRATRRTTTPTRSPPCGWRARPSSCWPSHVDWLLGRAGSDAAVEPLDGSSRAASCSRSSSPAGGRSTPAGTASRRAMAEALASARCGLRRAARALTVSVALGGRTSTAPGRCADAGRPGGAWTWRPTAVPATAADARRRPATDHDGMRLVVSTATGRCGAERSRCASTASPRSPRSTSTEPLACAASRCSSPRGGRSGEATGGIELVIRCRALTPLLAERRKPRARWRTKRSPTATCAGSAPRCSAARPGFAPGPPVVGPWRPVELVARRRPAVDALRVRTRLEGDDGRRGGPSGALRGRERSLEVRLGDAPVALPADGDGRWPASCASRRRALVAAHPRRAARCTTCVLRADGARDRAPPRRLPHARAGPTPGHDSDGDGLDLRVNGVRGVRARRAVDAACPDGRGPRDARAARATPA